MPRSDTTSRFSRSRGLPRATYDSWLASLHGEGSPDDGWPARVLAWAGSEQDDVRTFCIGAPATLSHGWETGWRHVGWHEIEHGGWNAELRQLSWVQVGGRRGTVPLDEPGRLPELFRERVEATIVVKRFLPLAGERGAVISARRDLSGKGTISWHTSLTRGLTWQSAGVREAVDEALAEARAEYDFG